MGTEIIYVGPDGKPLAKKKKKKAKVTEPTPMASRSWGDRRTERMIEEGPPPLTREQHMENMRREAEESRLENKRLRDQYEAHIRETKNWKADA
jgi:hypothetical protein